MAGRRWWLLMAVLAFGVGSYAVALLFLPQLRPPFLRNSPLEPALLAHFAGGGLALALGPFQFLPSLRARRPTLHRWMGRAYVTAILGSGTAGFVLAFFSQGGALAHAGFAMLAVSWLVTTTAAFVAIRRRDTRSHQRWMIRSFALTLAAVTLRVYLPVSLVIGVPFDLAYPVIAWACWVPNLLVAERRFVSRVVTPAAVAAVA